MPREFEIRREVELPASAQDVFDAVTSGTAAWLFPTGDVEPRVGGKAMGGAATVTAWEPPHLFANRAEGPDGWFNVLETVIEARDDGTAVLRYVHAGIFTDNWDAQYDGASQSTSFYLHTLDQYLRYFNRRPVTYVGASGGTAGEGPDAFTRVLGALGVTGASAGQAVHVEVPGLPGPVDGVVDYISPADAPRFLGVRTGDGLYRFFGHNAFGGSATVGHHLFAPGVDGEKAGQAWQSWLDGVLA
jgi:uncharacterized protein YndB with AHSA1/START domain